MKESKAITPTNKSVSRKKDKLIDKGLSYLRKTFLIVDGSANLKRLFPEILKLKFGESINILWEDDGDKALRLIFERNGDLDLLQTDVNHPGIEGLDLVEIVRQHYPHIKIIVCTGWIPKELLQKINREAFDHLMRKPVTVEKYLSVIETYLKA